MALFVIGVKLNIADSALRFEREASTSTAVTVSQSKDPNDNPTKLVRSARPEIANPVIPVPPPIIGVTMLQQPNLASAGVLKNDRYGLECSGLVACALPQL